jgi:hypothetical protein
LENKELTAIRKRILLNILEFLSLLKYITKITCQTVRCKISIATSRGYKNSIIRYCFTVILNSVRKQKNKAARNSVIVLPYQINLLKDILRIIDASS